MDIARRRADRLRFIAPSHRLYALTSGSETVFIDSGDLGDELGLSPSQLWDLVSFLEGAGLLTFEGLGGDSLAVRLTHAGIVEVEEALEAPDRPTEHFPPAGQTLVVMGDVTNSAIQQAGGNAAQTATLSSGQMAAIQRFLDLSTSIQQCWIHAG